MHKISKLATILITSFVMTLAGLVASPIATAAEDEEKNASVSILFKGDNTDLTGGQQEQLRDAVETVGTKASFTVKVRAAKARVKTDSSAIEAYDTAYRRGEEIRRYLAGYGIKVSKIDVQVSITDYDNPTSDVIGTYTPINKPKPVVKNQAVPVQIPKSIGDFETESTLTDTQKAAIRR